MNMNTEFVSRKVKHGKKAKADVTPVFTSRMEKREYYKSMNSFDIRNVLDVASFLTKVSANWSEYVSKVRAIVAKSPAKRILMTGIFTVTFSLMANNASACISEYTYEVKATDTIETVAAAHGVTPQQIRDTNGISTISNQKLLLPKVQEKTVTATSLNVRSHPSLDSKVIDKYKKGTKVKVSFIENGWAAILIKGSLAYVSAEYLANGVQTTTVSTKPATSEVKATTKVMYVKADSLRVRAAGNTQSSVLGSLKYNEKVSVISYQDGWAQISFKGGKAFVSAGYLSADVLKEQTQTSKPTAKTENLSVYTIQSGDTFSKLSRAYGISVKSIEEANPNVNSSKLKIGQKINLPANAEMNTNIVRIHGTVAGVDPSGTFRFIAENGTTYAAKVTSDAMLNELFSLQGEKLEFMLDVKRGQSMTLITIH